jgi:carbonic anhydrase
VTFPQDALDRLRQGNRRFASGEKTADERIRQTQRDRLVGDQQPFAAILGCSDSRVPVEIIFDQGPGDLFVIRIAGNIVTPSVVGSIEFAAERIGARLVVVLGHSHCGAA